MFVIANIFQPLIDVFETILKFFHNSVGISWGFSIVVLTIVVRAALIPLTFRQMRSMVKMQALAPELKKLQAKYKEDKERQQKEMFALYKQHGVHPASSCLPMVAQLPVFISLYYMLRQSLRSDICPGVQKAYQANYAAVHHVSAAAAKAFTTACGTGPHAHAGFLFISDLTNKATGATLIVLLVLYVGSQLASTILMSSASMDPNMRKAMMFMPLIFVLVVIRFPAGVLVYWITTNTWTIGQQYIVKRRMGPAVAVGAAAGADGDGETSVSASAFSNPFKSSGASRAANPRPDKVAAVKAGAGKSAPGGGRGGAGKSGVAGGKEGASTSSNAQNGSGNSLGALIRSKVKPEEKAPVATAPRGGPPPKSPRKKKKRSGRRR